MWIATGVRAFIGKGVVSIGVLLSRKYHGTYQTILLKVYIAYVTEERAKLSWDKPKKRCTALLLQSLRTLWDHTP
jgi:hypothetical protein